jgi:hypothetical protein
VKFKKLIRNYFPINFKMHALYFRVSKLMYGIAFILLAFEITSPNVWNIKGISLFRFSLLQEISRTWTNSLPNIKQVTSGLGSSVGIMTYYGLEGSGIESRWRWDFCVCPGRPCVPTSLLSFLRVKPSRGVLLTTHHLLVPSTWKSRAIPLPTLWAIQGL